MLSGSEQFSRCVDCTGTIPNCLEYPICVGCNISPAGISEYQLEAALIEVNVDEYVRREEGTLNPENGHFTCTACYIALGCPTDSYGRWVAP